MCGFYIFSVIMVIILTGSLAFIIIHKLYKEYIVGFITILLFSLLNLHDRWYAVSRDEFYMMYDALLCVVIVLYLVLSIKSRKCKSS